MKKEILSPKEKYELDKMWPKAEEYLLNERPEGMSFDEYKVRKRHEREMLKFRRKYYGFEPNVKIKKETRNNKGSSEERQEGSKPEVPIQKQTGNKIRKRTPVKK